MSDPPDSNQQSFHPLNYARFAWLVGQQGFRTRTDCIPAQGLRVSHESCEDARAQGRKGARVGERWSERLFARRERRVHRPEQRIGAHGRSRRVGHPHIRNHRPVLRHPLELGPERARLLDVLLDLERD